MSGRSPGHGRWPRRPLRSIAEVTLGRQRSPGRAEGPNMTPYLRAANVKDGHLDLDDVMSMDFSPVEQATFGLVPGDVLVTEGAGSLVAVGASAVWNGEIEGTVCFQNTLLRLRPQGGTDARFLAWWARCAYGAGVFASIAGGANIYHLGADGVRLQSIDVPPPSVQRQIADHLDAATADLDQLISARRRVLERLALRRRAAVDTALSPDRTSSWTRVPVKRLLQGIDQGWSPQCDSRPADPDEWAVLKAGAANGGVFRPGENKALPSGIRPLVRFEIKSGDLLVSRANTRELVASVCVVPEVRSRLLLCDKLFRLHVRADACPRFLAYALTTSDARAQIEAEATGTSDSMLNIGQDTIRELRVWAPAPGQVQEAIADDLDEHLAHARIVEATIHRQMDLLGERRQALITAVVTGELDIPGVA